MSSQNYTMKEVTNKINTELEIAVLLDTIFEEKLWHPDAPINEYLKNEEVEFDFTNKSSYTMVTCPLHDTENDDSTFYYHAKNNFICKVGHCRSLGKSLNAVNLYMILVKNVHPELLIESKQEFRESVQELAKMIGITGWKHSERKLSEEEKKELRKQKIRQEVFDFYHKEIFKDNDFSKRARDYFLIERGFGKLSNAEDFMKEQNIGYAGGKKNSTFIYNVFKKKGYTDEELLSAGIVRFKTKYIPGKDGKKGKSVPTEELVDFFTNRITFPYMQGNIVEHGYGRDIITKEEFNKLTDNEKERNKRMRHLRFAGGVDQPVNINQAKKSESLIVVEGEIDLLTFLALGFTNVIATGGTNGLDEKDIRNLKYLREKSGRKLCNTIYFCLDDDAAGNQAMLKLGNLFIQEEFDVRVIRLIDNDPNDYLIEHGEKAKEELQKLIDNALSFEAFAALLILSERKVKTLADKRAALLSARKELVTVNKAELLFIAMEVAELLNVDTPVSQQIPLEWLLHAWELVPNASTIEPEGFEKAIEKSWVFITEDKERFDSLIENGRLGTPIFVPDMMNFISKIKRVNHVQNIVLDCDITNESKLLLAQHLSDYKFKEFYCENNEIVKNASQTELLAMFRKFELPELKAS